jgi:hypothetical protein
VLSLYVAVRIRTANVEPVPHRSIAIVITVALYVARADCETLAPTTIISRRPNALSIDVFSAPMMTLTSFRDSR